jgi:predicted AlkP superfamily phosphohydrolase/phosphomutase
MKPTLLIGLDGATFSILDPLMDNGTMPFLKKFLQKGVRAELLSTSNPLTPPAWISLMTGRTPGNHGVFDFIWAEERKTDHYFTIYNFRDIRCETIWTIVSRYNGSVCSLNFPFMSPPPAVSGSIIPGFVSWKHLRRNVYPRDMFDDLKKLEGFNVRELAWDFDMEKKAEKGVPKEEYENWVKFHIRRERQWFAIAKYFMKKNPSNLTAILLDGTDKLLHMGWRFLDPDIAYESFSDEDLKIRSLCHEYFRELDQFMSEIIELAGPETRVFMASDHGFGPSKIVFRVNTWLNQEGYLTWRDINGMDDNNKASAKKLVDGHFVLLDWDNTTAYARTVTSNGIYIRVARKPGQSGIPEEQYDAFRKKLIDKLLAFKDPATGENIIKKVLTKEEAYPGDNNDQAPDLLLVMKDYSFASIMDKTPVVIHRPEVEGTHVPEGIFLAKGPGIREGVEVKQHSIIDVAPCLLYSLGLPIPSDFEGKLPEDIFEQSFLEQNPLQTGEPTHHPESYDASAQKEDSEEKEEIYKRLRALGYME